MLLWEKIWYYTENYKTSIYKGKKDCRLPKTKKKFIYNRKTFKFEDFEQICSSGSLIYIEKNYGSMEQKYYGTKEKNYGTIPKTMELWFTIEKKTMALWKKVNYCKL